MANQVTGSTLSGAASGAMAGAALGPWGAAVGGVVGGAVGFIKGKKAQGAEDDLDSMQNLDYTQSLAYKSAQLSEDLAARQAQEGLPQESMDYYNDQINRTTASGLNSISSLRSGVAGVGSLAGSALDSTRQLVSMDANQRVKNRENWFNQRDNLVSQQQTAFDYEMGYDMLERARYLSQISAGQQESNQWTQEAVNNGGNLAEMGFGQNGRRGDTMTPMQSLPSGEISTSSNVPQLQLPK